MAHAALESWRRTCRSGTPQFVGSFYERLARYLLGGEMPNDSAEGDLSFDALDGTPIGVEVKGCGDSNAPRIRWGQLKRHKARMQGFPYNGHFLYLLFCYSGRVSEGPRGFQIRESLVCKAVDNGTGDELLVQRTLRLWILSLSMIEWLRGNEPFALSMFSKGNEDPRVFHLGRKRLQKLVNQENTLLPAPWTVRQGEVSIPANLLSEGLKDRMSFPVTHFRDHTMPEIDFRHIQWQT